MIINASLPGSGGAKLACGSYVGTGTHGEDNKNTVNVGFAPKLFFVFRDDPRSDGKGDVFVTDPEGCGLWVVGRDALLAISGNSSTRLTRPCNVSGTVVGWYLSYAGVADYMLAGSQLNGSGTTYRWFALG